MANFPYEAAAAEDDISNQLRVKADFNQSSGSISTIRKSCIQNNQPKQNSGDGYIGQVKFAKQSRNTEKASSDIIQGEVASIPQEFGMLDTLL